MPLQKRATKCQIKINAFNLQLILVPVQKRAYFWNPPDLWNDEFDELKRAYFRNDEFDQLKRAYFRNHEFHQLKRAYFRNDEFDQLKRVYFRNDEFDQLKSSNFHVKRNPPHDQFDQLKSSNFHVKFLNQRGDQSDE